MKITIPIIILMIIAGCTPEKPDYYSFSGFAQGTTYSVIYNSESNIDPEIMKYEIDSLLDAFDQSLSTYNKESLISSLNSGIEVEADELLMTVFKSSVEVNKLSDGAFDISLGPLVNAWGFGPDARRRFNPEMLDSLMQLVGMDKISLVGNRIIKADRRIYIDVNAIAQGYSVDVICDYMLSRGVSRCLAEVGGEVRTVGSKYPDQPWQVAIDKPMDNNLVPGEYIQAIINLDNNSLATSGNYRKFYEGEDGVKCSHTIDPATGSPVQHNLLSATIISGECMIADAFATACMVVGLEKAKELINRYEYLEGYLVYSDENGEFRTWYTGKMIDYISE